jgi:ABC-2 type transport system ATP-binding protein
MDASGPALIVENLSKSYGNLRALDGVALTVDPGEFVALLGPNGAGKSTLLQLLTGLFSPDEGRISVLGYDLRRNPTQALAGIGVVFQQTTLDLELSVRANLAFHADLHGLSRGIARERIGAALQRFGLSDRARDRARALSGGNRRRVELARALLHRPRILLMDEATVGLDPASRRDIISDMSHLKQEAGVGILWTTHLVDEAERADRIAVLHKGRIVFDGTPAALLEAAVAATISEAFFKLTGSRGAQDEAA